MAVLVENQVDGPNCYCAGYVVPAQGEGSVGSGSTHPLAALRGTLSEDSTQTLTIVVDHDVPFLMGSVTTESGAYPAGVNVTLKDPGGNTVTPSQTDARFVVCNNNDPRMLQSCMIRTPMPGTWTVTVENADNSSYVFFSTMPTAAQYPTIYNTLTPLADRDALGAGPEGASGCWGCKITCWVVAVAAAALLGLAAALLTAGAAPVIACAVLLGSVGLAISAAGVVVILQALLAGAGAAVGIIVLNMCSWVNACPTGVTATLTSPATGETVRRTVLVNATATNATTVAFYVAQQTLIGTATSGLNWNIDWDTTQISNGEHTVSALATGSNGASWSPAVKVIVQN
ncbi:Ig-like domain-containing protein [Amycolatopsis alba]|uniref:Ig-like domain-containing protein n=1 Tax=Amycolatopsis alba TaxID=76020 RepID=UPI00117858A3|nr:Ig-like domain-containing protein [Amycolatopsis alba]